MERDAGNKASQVGRGHIVEGFSSQAEELQIRQWKDIGGFKAE